MSLRKSRVFISVMMLQSLLFSVHSMAAEKVMPRSEIPEKREFILNDKIMAIMCQSKMRT